MGIKVLGRAGPTLPRYPSPHSCRTPVTAGVQGAGGRIGVAATDPREWNGRQLAWVSRPRVHQMMLGEPV